MVPANIIFNPNWWWHEYGISFDESFYMDSRRRIKEDLAMRKALFERFQYGTADSESRPVLGSENIAGGFVIPALFGAELRFSEDQAPWALPCDLSRQAVWKLRVPDLEEVWPLNRLLRQAEDLVRDFGFVVGDINTDGVLNTALCLRGQQLFEDFYDDPELVAHLFGVIAGAICAVAHRIRKLTGSTSISVNRSIVDVDRRIFLHANCSFQMISPEHYRKHLLETERYLAEELRPYGIHHCGSNCHTFADCYAQLGVVFLDVGAGSEITPLRVAMPGAFLNLRLSPVALLTAEPMDIRREVRRLISESGRFCRTGVCCINMDHGTPDRNVSAMLEAAAAGLPGRFE